MDRGRPRCERPPHRGRRDPRPAFATVDGERVCVPYLNLYLCNGAVVVPVSGHPADDEMCARIAEAVAPEGRTVVPVPGTTLAVGGGGPHCITQQIPTQQIPTQQIPQAPAR